MSRRRHHDGERELRWLLAITAMALAGVMAAVLVSGAVLCR